MTGYILNGKPPTMRKFMEGEREACIEMGCDDYFPKPIDGPKLMNLVAFHLGK